MAASTADILRRRRPTIAFCAIKGLALGGSVVMAAEVIGRLW